MTTGKTIALTRWTFVGKVMSLLLNMLSRLVITFLPRSKCLLISWLKSPSAVILQPQEIKSDTVSTVSLFSMNINKLIIICVKINNYLLDSHFQWHYKNLTDEKLPVLAKCVNTTTSKIISVQQVYSLINNSPNSVTNIYNEYIVLK